MLAVTSLSNCTPLFTGRNQVVCVASVVVCGAAWRVG